MGSLNTEAAWKATLGELELQMTKATFNTWLKDARLLGCDDNEYVIGVRNDYARDWLEIRLQDTIMRTLSTIIGQPVSIRFIVSSDEPAIAQTPTISNGQGERVMVEPSATLSSNGHLNGRYTFSTFVVGTRAIGWLTRPLCLSPSSLVHDLQSPLHLRRRRVGQDPSDACHRPPLSGTSFNVYYVSSETFTNDLIQSIRSQKMAEFRERYRNGGCAAN
jgi:chromosomal replication initiator protein